MTRQKMNYLQSNLGYASLFQSPDEPAKDLQASMYNTDESMALTRAEESGNYASEDAELYFNPEFLSIPQMDTSLDTGTN